MKKNGKESLVSSIIGFSLASWITTLIGLVVVPISTRIILPDELGKINLFNSVVSIAYPLFCFGLDHGYMRLFNEIDDRQRKFLWTKSIIISLGIITAGAVIILPFREAVSFAIVGEKTRSVFSMLVISLCSYTIERYILVRYRMTDEAFRYTSFALVCSLVNKVIFILPALFGMVDYKSALIFTTVFNIALIFLTMLFSKRYILFKGGAGTKRALIQESFAFGWPLMLVVVINQITQNAPKFFLKEYTDYTSVAIFASAATIASVVTIAQSGFSLVWTPYVYANYKDKPEEIDRLHRCVVCIITGIAAILISFQHLFVWLLGSYYRNITTFLPIMVLSPVLLMFGEITGIGINIAKKTFLHFIYNAAGVAITVLFCIVLIPIWGSVGAAIAALLGGLTVFIIRTFLAQKYYSPVYSYKYIIFSIVVLSALAGGNCIYDGNILISSILSAILFLFGLWFYRKQLAALFVLFMQYYKQIILRN